jgi:hypothetical protein
MNMAGMGDSHVAPVNEHGDARRDDGAQAATGRENSAGRGLRIVFVMTVWTFFLYRLVFCVLKRNLREVCYLLSFDDCPFHCGEIFSTARAVLRFMLLNIDLLNKSCNMFN